MAEARQTNPLGNLPEKGQRMWEDVYASAQERGHDQGAAAAQAWCAVKRYYYKKGDKWRKRKKPLKPSQQPPGCTPIDRAANPSAAGRKAMQELLAMLRAGYMTYRTGHWQTSGTGYYGKHLLLQRIYESAEKHVDMIGERTVGMYGPEAVDEKQQAKMVQRFMAQFAEIDDPIEQSLEAARSIRDKLQTTYDVLEATGDLNLGTDDLIMSIANDKEEHIYLLQQALENPEMVANPERGLKSRLLR